MLATTFVLCAGCVSWSVFIYFARAAVHGLWFWTAFALSGMFALRFGCMLFAVRRESAGATRALRDAIRNERETICLNIGQNRIV